MMHGLSGEKLHVKVESQSKMTAVWQVSEGKPLVAVGMEMCVEAQEKQSTVSGSSFILECCSISIVFAVNILRRSFFEEHSVEAR
jgi:hypothetical protein